VASRLKRIRGRPRQWRRTTLKPPSPRFGATQTRLCRLVFDAACQLGCEGIVSKRLGSPYRSGRSPQWVKVKNPNAPAVKREAEEDWGRRRTARRWIPV